LKDSPVPGAACNISSTDTITTQSAIIDDAWSAEVWEGSYNHGKLNEGEIGAQGGGEVESGSLDAMIGAGWSDDGFQQELLLL